MLKPRKRGFTLIELLVSVGLFAIVTLIAAGAYLIMLTLNRNAQALSSGSDNLAFALETMTRMIRTGTGYGCGLAAGTNCPNGVSTFVFTDSSGPPTHQWKVSLSGGAISLTQTANNAIGGGNAVLDLSTTKVTGLNFYATGVVPYNNGAGDTLQPYVTMVIQVLSQSGANVSQTYTIETGAAMRGSDL